MENILHTKKILRIVITLFTFCFINNVCSQNVGINLTGANADPSSILDVASTNKGILIPRLALSATNLNAPIGAGIATSLLVYNTATAGVAPNHVTPGYYYWDGAVWLRLATGNQSWSITGNAGTVDGINFLGTTDNVPLNFRVNNVKAGRIAQTGAVFLGYEAGNVNTYSLSTAIGHQALYSNTTGPFNTAVGYQSLYSNTTGDYNTAHGYSTLQLNTGSRNTAVGATALSANTSGDGNTGVGAYALYGNTTGHENTGMGESVLRMNTTGYLNTAVGMQALSGNTTGNNNTAIGENSLGANFTGSFNTASGSEALNGNLTGDENTAHGYRSLYWSTSGSNNTANGTSVLFENTTGSFNTSNGSYSLYNNTIANSNTALGYYALFNNTIGANNTAIGDHAFTGATSYSNSTALGYNTTITANNQVRIGNAAVTSIGGQVGWTTLSDARLKTTITENVPGLAFITKLRPITYYHDMSAIAGILKTPDNLRLTNAELQAGQLLHTGFIAQEVEQAANELGFKFSGIDKPKNETDYYGLRYAEFTVPLVKAVQEQQKFIEEQQRITQTQQQLIQELKQEIELLKKK